MMIRLKIEKDQVYNLKNREVIVRDVVSINKVLIEDLQRKSKQVIDISQLTNIKAEATKSINIESYTQKEWQEAERRLEIIKPLLKSSRTEKEVTERAKLNEVNRSTLYRWLNEYESSESLMSLIPSRRGRKKGQKLLDDSVEVLIEERIQNFYLTKERVTIPELILEIGALCNRLGKKAPHENTIRNRVNSLSKELVYKKRVGKKEAKLKYGAVKGSYQQAKYPLSIVQIDHTPLDIVLVDNVNRKAVGRPYITVVIDVYSRVVLGFYLSYDPVSSTSVGLAIAHAVGRKEEYLHKLGVQGAWNVSGLFHTIHVDNAKEFRSKAFVKACQKYGMSIEWRPVGRPDFGGHVESFIGTLNSKIRNLPGSTFSNVIERHNYKSEKEASLTLKELETWITEYIINIYHEKKHSGINMSPNKKLDEGLFGNEDMPGIGIPDQVEDLDLLKIDYMPEFERTIQRYGVSIDNIYYYSDVLKKWIYSEEKRNHKRKFIFKRDPRDISKVYFYDPELNEYFEIPYRNTTRPALNIWEFNDARKAVIDSNGDIDEESIFRAHERMQEIKKHSLKEKKKAARSKKGLEPIKKTDNVAAIEKVNDDFEEEIKPFEDITEW